MIPKHTILWLVALLAIFGCGKIDPKPAPPAGEFVIGGEEGDVALDAVQMADGSWLMVGGLTENGNGYTPALVKLDAEGNELWQRTYPEAGNDALARFILEDPNGGYDLVICDFNGQSFYGYEFRIMSLDADFNMTDGGRIPESFAQPAASWPGNNAIKFGFDQYIISTHNQGTHTVILGTPDFPPQYLVTQSYTSSYLIFKTLFEKRPGGYLFVRDGTEFNSNGIYVEYFQENLIKDTHYSLFSRDFFGDDSDQIHPTAICPLDSHSFMMAFNIRSQDFGLARVNPVLNQVDMIEFGQNPVTEIVMLPDSSWLAVGDDFHLERLGVRGPDGEGAQIYITRVDKDLNEVISQSTLGGEDSDRVNRLVMGDDGRVLIVGQTQSYGEGGLDMYYTFYQN